MDPEYKNHRLTHAGMEQVIREGGSVLYTHPDGHKQIITRADALPAEAEIVKGDKAGETAVAAKLQAQIRAAQAQLDSLTATGQLPGVPPAPGATGVTDSDAPTDDDMGKSKK